MALLASKTRTAIFLLLGCATICAISHAQTDTPNDKPLPDTVAMMRDVEANQHKAESAEKNYLYHSVETRQELAGDGHVKKTTVYEFDHSWINGVPIERMVKKNGKDLNAEESAKEDERINKEVASAREKRDSADSQGKETDPRGNEEVTVSRLIELGSFTNARRVQLNGRDTIAVDFAGDPRAKTRNRTEEIIRDLQGTAWIDEQDHVLARVEGHFANAFRIAGGLIASVQKDTQFSMEQTKINDEVWLPMQIEGQGAIHALFFFGFSGNLQVVNSNYRKFRTSSRLLPEVTPTTTPETPDHPIQP